MDSKILKNLQPAEYLRRFLEKDLRPDGRKFFQTRRVNVQTGVISSARGSAQVSLGNTTVTCAIKAEVAVPSWDSPTSGYIVPNVDLPPLCHSGFKPGAPPELTQHASDYINKITK
jgi:exosome complex component RRP43